MYEKDISANAAALKKDLKSHIANIQAIHEQVQQMSSNEVSGMDKQLEKAMLAIKQEESKAKEKVLKSVKESVSEQEGKKLENLV